MGPKVRLFTILAVVTLVAGAIGYILLKKPTPQPASQTNNSTQPQTTPEKDNTPTPDPAPAAKTPDSGIFTAYSESAFANAKGRRILFFHAPWCPQCRNIEKTINEQGIPAGMTILKVDYDSAQQLRQKYGVTMQTTFVELDTAGNLRQKHVAYNEPTIDAVIKALGQ